MRFKLLAATVISLAMISTGCSVAERVVYRPDINQGNYLTEHQIQKLKIGMNQQQVAYILGSPMLQDPFGGNSWIYAFRQQPGHETAVQQTLTLTFDSNNVLRNIENKEALKSN